MVKKIKKPPPQFCDGGDRSIAVPLRFLTRPIPIRTAFCNGNSRGRILPCLCCKAGHDFPFRASGCISPLLREPRFQQMRVLSGAPVNGYFSRSDAFHDIEMNIPQDMRGCQSRIFFLNGNFQSCRKSSPGGQRSSVKRGNGGKYFYPSTKSIRFYREAPVRRESFNSGGGNDGCRPQKIYGGIRIRYFFISGIFSLCKEDVRFYFITGTEALSFCSGYRRGDGEMQVFLNSLRPLSFKMDS